MSSESIYAERIFAAERISSAISAPLSNATFRHKRDHAGQIFLPSRCEARDVPRDSAHDRTAIIFIETLSKCVMKNFRLHSERFFLKLS
jgi:hypothetical protein